jgi:hypothetical protein
MMKGATQDPSIEGIVVRLSLDYNNSAFFNMDLYDFSVFYFFFKCFSLRRFGRFFPSEGTEIVCPQGLFLRHGGSGIDGTLLWDGPADDGSLGADPLGRMEIDGRGLSAWSLASV